MATQEQWANLLEPGLRTLFNLQFAATAASSRIPMLFNVMDSGKSSEYFLGIGGFGDWNAYTGKIEYDDPEEGYKITLTHTEYTRGFQVERRLVDDDLYNVIKQRPRNLGLAAARTREKHAASIFNNAFSGSYVGGDAVALCSASHPRSPGNASTQSNTGTSALTYDTVISTRQSMRAYTDDRGELIPVNPDLILVPPELEDEANKIVNTMNGSAGQKPDTTDYVDNLLQRQGVGYLVWDYLTNANNWFMIDSQMAMLHLLWIDRRPLEFTMDPTSDFNLVAKFRGYMRYSYGWSDWRWVYGQNVT